MASLVRIGSAVAATVAVLAFGVACSKSSGDSSGASPGGNQAQDGRQAYVDCLRQHGVNLPSMGPGRPSGRPFPSGRPSGRPFPSGRPTSRPSNRPTDRPGGFPGGFSGGIPSGVDAQTWQQAQQACESVRPSFGSGNGNGPGGNGPGGNGSGGNGRGGANAAFRNCMSEHGVTPGQGQLNTADPKVAEALKICDVLRVTAAPSPSS